MGASLQSPYYSSLSQEFVLLFIVRIKRRGKDEGNPAHFFRFSAFVDASLQWYRDGLEDYALSHKVHTFTQIRTMVNRSQTT